MSENHADKKQEQKVRILWKNNGIVLDFEENCIHDSILPLLFACCFLMHDDQSLNEIEHMQF